MSENPYAPPTADLGSEPLSATGSRGDFDIGQCLSDAWANTWANFPLWLGVGIVGLVAAVVATATVIGLFLVVPVLVWGGLRFCLRMHDGDAEFGDLFAGFSCYGTALVGMLVCLVLVTLISLVGQLPQIVGEFTQSDALIIGGFVVSLAFTFLVTARLFFAYFYVVDRDLSPVESLTRSWEVTGPIKWKVAGLLLVSYAVVFAGLLVLVVGVIPATVGWYLMWISAFRQIEGRPASA